MEKKSVFQEGKSEVKSRSFHWPRARQTAAGKFRRMAKVGMTIVESEVETNKRGGSELRQKQILNLKLEI